MLNWLVSLGLALKSPNGSNCTITTEYINSDSNSTERTEIQPDSFNPTTHLIENSDPFCDGKLSKCFHAVIKVSKQVAFLSFQLMHCLVSRSFCVWITSCHSFLRLSCC